MSGAPVPASQDRLCCAAVRSCPAVGRNGNRQPYADSFYRPGMT